MRRRGVLPAGGLAPVPAFGLALGLALGFGSGPAAGCVLPGEAGFTLGGQAPEAAAALRPQGGQPLALAWQDPWPDPEACAGARYLILGLPEAVRLSGTGFFALAPGERAPFGIDHAADRLRVVVPLHLAEAQSGRLEILPWLIGPARIDWAHVHVPLDEGGRAGAPAVRPGAGAVLDIRPGPPEVVVQDPFDTELPRERVLSGNGVFLLEVFEGHYRVRDAATGALVVAAEGLRPGFSPTGRFVHAFGGDILPDDRSEIGGEAEVAYHADLVLHDLYTAREVVALRRGGWSGRGDFVAGLRWSPGDGYLVVLYEASGMIGFQPMLVDGRPHWRDEYGCGACSAQEEGVAVIDPENAMVTLGWSDSRDRLSLIGDAAPGLRYWERDPVVPPHPALVAAPEPVALARRPVFDLLGPARASFDHRWDGAGVEVVAHRPLAAAALPGPLRDDEGRRRGAEAIGAAELPNRGGRLIQRLAEAGVALAPAPPLAGQRVRSEAAVWLEEVLIPFWDSGEEGDEPDEPAGWLRPGGHYFDTGRAALAAGLVDAAEAAALTRVAIAAFEAQPQCTMHRVGEAQLWTLRRGGGVEQMLHWHCRVSTGYAPEGVLVLLRVAGGQATWELLAAAPDYGWAEEEEADGDRDAVEAEDDLVPVGPVPVAVHQPLRLARLDERRLAVAGADARISLVDLSARRIEAELRDVVAPAQIETMALTLTGGHLLQANADGRFFVHDLDGGGALLSGVHVDDELVAFDAGLNFAATPEGARHVQLRFPGERALYGLDQLGARYGAEGVVAAALARAPLPAPAPPALPPRIDAVEAAGGTVRLRALAEGGLADVALYRDGVEVARVSATGPEAALTLALPALPETRWFALRATDAQGLTSRAALLPAAPAGPPRGRLRVLAVGIDRYDDPRIARLRHAVSDARGFAAALTAAEARYYAGVEAEVLVDSEDLRRDLPARLAQLTAGMAAEDTLMLLIAGHGFVDAAGALRLADRSTRLDDLAGSALAFDDLAGMLAALPGRVVVFLDACHSGAAGAGTNDDAVAALLAEGRAVAVVAASKGRQPSFEAPGFGGGAFTAALIRALTGPGGDLDGNGTVELSELYARVKREVVLATEGEQTPWIARSGFVGEVPLF